MKTLHLRCVYRHFSSQKQVLSDLPYREELRVVVVSDHSASEGGKLAKKALALCMERQEIPRSLMRNLMLSVFNGEVPEPLLAAVLVGLRMKGETIEELTEAATVLRSLATAFPLREISETGLLDIVGTGGDSLHTFNISSAAAVVVAAGGACVAKHGNRGVSSSSGSADVFETLGANIDLDANQVAECLKKVGLAFLFAPVFHPAMHRVAKLRRELGIRTLFNVLGPLANPAGVHHILVGVFHPDWIGRQIRVLENLGARQAMVVCGEDGMDEISLCSATRVSELREGKVREYSLSPEAFGLQRWDKTVFQVRSPDESKEKFLEAISGKPGGPYEIVVVNAAAALYTAGLADSIEKGVEMAQSIICSGAAMQKLEAFVKQTQLIAARR